MLRKWCNIVTLVVYGYFVTVVTIPCFTTFYGIPTYFQFCRKILIFSSTLYYILQWVHNRRNFCLKKLPKMTPFLSKVHIRHIGPPHNAEVPMVAQWPWFIYYVVTGYFQRRRACRKSHHLVLHSSGSALVLKSKNPFRGMTWIEITPWMVWFGWMCTELKSNSMHVHFKYVQFWSCFDLGQLMPINSSMRRTDSKPGPPTCSLSVTCPHASANVCQHLRILCYTCVRTCGPCGPSNMFVMDKWDNRSAHPCS